MYSYDDRKRAIELFIQFDLCVADTVRALGYPNRKMLVKWYKEYIKTGLLHKVTKRTPQFTEHHIKMAVDYYCGHGRSITRTIKAIGYPSRQTLTCWIKERVPKEHKVRMKRSGVLLCSQEQKQEAVIAWCAKAKAAVTVTDMSGISSYHLHQWKKELLGEESPPIMNASEKSELLKTKKALLEEVKSLQQKIDKQQMELDILHKAAEIIKKDPGIDLRNLSNKEKTSLIDALRTKYALNALLTMIRIAKRCYFYHKEAQKLPGKYSVLRTKVKNVFIANYSCYGYRRIHAEITSKGIMISEKVIRRIMREEQLRVLGKKNRKYSSYIGEISPAVENLVARDFRADTPNTTWLTDLTEFHIPAGKVYLSPIIDCFDGMAVSWTIGTRPDAALVNTMLDDAIGNLKVGERPVVHSDRGCHYRWPGWILSMENSGLQRSMSKKGCTQDNAACEGFFGRIKNEMFVNRSWKDVSIEQFIDFLDQYLTWYNEKRIKMSLGGMSPVAYRRSMGLTP